MSDFFLGEIRAFTMGYAPAGWHLCDGTLLPISGNQALFSLLGTAFGGNGTTTFGIPDLRGRAVLGATSFSGGTPYPRGAAGGQESVVLTQAQIPAHYHTFNVLNSGGTFPIPTGNTISGAGTSTAVPVAPNLFAAGAATVPLNPATIQPSGGSAGHTNVQPSLVINYCIATTGLYPQRN